MSQATAEPEARRPGRSLRWRSGKPASRRCSSSGVTQPALSSATRPVGRERVCPASQKRLPAGLRTLIEQGHDRGLITQLGGLRFTLWPGCRQARVHTSGWAGTALDRCRRCCGSTSSKPPNTCASPSNLHRSGIRFSVEDRLMDITVTRDDLLLWYVEVKERARRPARVHREDRRLMDRSAWTPPLSRGDDALAKAQYLMRYRPRFFSVTAIGLTFHSGPSTTGPPISHSRLISCRCPKTSQASRRSEHSLPTRRCRRSRRTAATIWPQPTLQRRTAQAARLPPEISSLTSPFGNSDRRTDPMPMMSGSIPTHKNERNVGPKPGFGTRR